MSFEGFMLTKNELEAIEQSLKDIRIILGRSKKRENAKASIRKAKENGSRIGRNKIRNDENIAKLRKRGMTIRAIAKVEGVSTTAVQRALKSKVF